MIPVFKRKKSELHEVLSHRVRLELERMLVKLGDILACVSNKELSEVELSMLREELNHYNTLIQHTMRKTSYTYFNSS